MCLLHLYGLLNLWLDSSWSLPHQGSHLPSSSLFLFLPSFLPPFSSPFLLLFLPPLLLSSFFPFLLLSSIPVFPSSQLLASKIQIIINYIFIFYLYNFFSFNHKVCNNTLINAITIPLFISSMHAYYII